MSELYDFVKNLITSCSKDTNLELEPDYKSNIYLLNNIPLSDNGPDVMNCILNFIEHPFYILQRDIGMECAITHIINEFINKVEYMYNSGIFSKLFLEEELLQILYNKYPNINENDITIYKNNIQNNPSYITYKLNKELMEKRTEKLLPLLTINLGINIKGDIIEYITSFQVILDNEIAKKVNKFISKIIDNAYILQNWYTDKFNILYDENTPEEFKDEIVNQLTNSEYCISDCFDDFYKMNYRMHSYILDKIYDQFIKLLDGKNILLSLQILLYDFSNETKAIHYSLFKRLAYDFDALKWILEL